jgi:SAM-dependent methyltransferase
MIVDFSRTARDYVTYRSGFPDELYRRLAGYGIGEPGQRVVDLGTGPGYLGRSLARRGARVTGVDLSEALLAQARQLDAQAGLSLAYVRAPAEDTGLPAASFDVVTAGQCWHWFDRPRAAREARRLLGRGGRLCLAHFDWIPRRGDVVEATEALIEQHNPAQPKPHVRFGGAQGIYPAWTTDAIDAGFTGLETWTFDVEVPFSHDAWRGRIRASQGVGAMLSPDAVRRFDDELRALLERRFAAEPLSILHRAFALIAERSSRPDETP